MYLQWSSQTLDKSFYFKIFIYNHYIYIIILTLHLFDSVTGYVLCFCIPIFFFYMHKEIKPHFLMRMSIFWLCIAHSDLLTFCTLKMHSNPLHVTGVDHKGWFQMCLYFWKQIEVHYAVEQRKQARCHIGTRKT